MKLAANLSLLYGALPVEDRFAAAANDGFRFVEILAPYDYPPNWYAEQLQKYSLQLVLINTPNQIDNGVAGMGFAAQPKQEIQFQTAISQAAQVCKATGCNAVHVMAGNLSPQFGREQQSHALQNNLVWASKQYPNLRFHLEALNTEDAPNYFYSQPAQVAHHLGLVHQRIKSEKTSTADHAINVGMQFDFYHTVKQGLNITEQLREYFSYIFHVQVAGASGRHEPHPNKDGIRQGFEKLYALGYQGYIGLEYRPLHSVSQGLSWLNGLRLNMG